MPTPDSILEAIQIQIVDRLSDDPYFDDITVLHQQIHNIQNEIDTAVASIGVCVVVVTPSADMRKTRDTKDPYFDAINIIVRVQENVIVNQDVASGGTGKSALAIAENVLAVMHSYKPDALSEAFTGVSPTIVIVDTPNGLLTYDVQLRTSGGIQYEIDQVATPVVSSVAGTVTITCATSHAILVYSLDGKPPTPRKANAGTPTAYFYDAPFATTVGNTVKVRGWLPGYLTSELVSHTVA